MPYIYNDEDNAPMNDDVIPFGDPPECCGTCRNFNGNFCTREWNNLDECYNVTWRDERIPEDWCEDYALDEGLGPDDWADVDAWKARENRCRLRGRANSATDTST